ncbi:MAG: hypothetical protein CFE26_15025, partial [Verrucomicrobiales bacterium VVV1]
MTFSRASITRFFAAVFLFAACSVQAQSTWDNRTAQITGSNYSNVGFAHNGERFLMVTNTPSTYWCSAAGTSNWTSSFFQFPTTGVTGLSIAHGAGATVVAGGNNVLMRTTVANPVTADWTSQRPITRPNSTNPALYRVRYVNSQFVVGTLGYVDSTTPANGYSELITSSTGSNATWTSRKF